MNISIPNPCHENWDLMQPGEKGRFCNTCCKTVIDFTGMSTEAISTYLQKHRSQQVCGRFTAGQLTQDHTTFLSLTRSILQSALSYTRKLAAVFLLFFALSQDSQAQTIKKSTGKDSVTIGQQPFWGRVAICPPKPGPAKKKIPYKTERLPVLKSDLPPTDKKIMTTGIVVLSANPKQ